MIQIFAKDNPRFKMTSLIADDVTFPMETPLDSNQRLGDVKDLYPLLLVHIGSNGGAFLVRFPKFLLSSFTCSCVFMFSWNRTESSELSTK